MKAAIRVKSLRLYVSTVTLLFILLNFLLVTVSHAKIYIDITAPAIRKLPISIDLKGPARAKEIEWIIKNDLETTGLFEFYDPDVPGAEIIAELDVEISDGLKTVLSIRDLVENKEVLKKRLDASNVIIRAMAHSISNDIYKIATGKKGIFRTKISYLTVQQAKRKVLRIMDWDGYNSRKIVSRGLTAVHSWSQDGQYLFYSAERNRKWTIYVLDLKRAKESILFSSNGLNLVGGTSNDNLIAFSSSKDGSSEIYSINQHGNNLKKITRSISIDVSPVYSPDGKKIAFVSDRGGSPQIYTMKSTGTSVRRVTFEGSYNTSPNWSPDGDHIVYVSRKNGKNQIFVVKSDGTDIRQLTIEGNNESPSFSPDGTLIVFDSDREKRHGIYIMRVNGEGKKRITPKHVSATSPKWSPYLKQ